MTLSRMINKTPLKNELLNSYEIEGISSDTLKNILQSRFISEGVYTLEQLHLTDYSEYSLHTPSFDKFNFNQRNTDLTFTSDEVREMQVLEMELVKPSFMPLDVKQHVNLLETIESYTHCPIFTQVLISKRQDNWRENTIDMYEQYLRGDDLPSDIQTVRKVQDKILGVLNKIGRFEMNRDKIAEMEQKILQPNFRVEIRFIVYYGKYLQDFSDFLRKTVKNLTFFNEITINKCNKKEMLRLIKDREFKSSSVNQLFSDQELFSLLTNKTIQPVQEVIVPTVKSVTNNKTTSSTFTNTSHTLLQAIQHMPQSNQTEKVIDETIPTKINKVFQRVNITKKNLKVSEVLQGSTLHKTQMIIPSDIVFTQFTKKLKDIQSALGSESVSIEMGDKPDTINIFTPLHERGILYFRTVLETEEFKQFAENNPLPFIIGEKATGGYEFACLSKLRHLMIAGATGSGKSVSVNLMILSFLLTIPPDELMLYLIDPKMVEFSQFDGFPQVKDIVTDMEKAAGRLESLVKEMEKRYKQLAEAGVKNIQTYNQKNPDEKMPYIVTVIDEYADLVMVNGAVEDHIVRLGQKARAAGIHLILATQRPSSDIVTGVIKANLPSTICFRLKSHVDYKTVFGKTIPYQLLGRGDGVAEIEGQHKEFERFQSPTLTIDESEEEQIYENLKQLFKDVEVNHNELEEIKKEEPVEKLKRILATNGIMPISEIQKEMGIGINVVSELMRELVDEEWLGREGRKYVITAEEEELNKWRDSDE
jgi:DNA segregation ATPase FtsK/SpoIIIE, S-DNA-T family